MTAREQTINRDIILTTRQEYFRTREQSTPMEAMMALAQMQQRPRPGLSLVRDADHVTLIGQVTRHGSTYDPVTSAIGQVQAGADAIALYTDHTLYTNDLEDVLMMARALRDVPLIYQNVIFDEYGVVAARASDASAVLVYASLLEPAQLRRVVTAAQRWKMTAFVQYDAGADFAAVCDLSPHGIAFGVPDQTDFAGALDAFLRCRDRLPRYIRPMLLPALADLEQAARALAAGIRIITVRDALLRHEYSAARLRELVASYRE